MDFWTELERARARCNVLDHPFYRRWSEGELSAGELATYAGQYRHAVVALADAAAHAARAAEPAIRAQLSRHAAEEAAHVALWDAFTIEVGGDRAADPAPETADCARAWAGEERDLLSTLAAMYAIESGQPEIAEVKLDGLRRHYGVDHPAATMYFDVHVDLDREHAAAERALIEERLEDGDAGSLLAEAEAVLSANWRLLDGVDRVHGR